MLLKRGVKYGVKGDLENDEGDGQEGFSLEVNLTEREYANVRVTDGDDKGAGDEIMEEDEARESSQAIYSAAVSSLPPVEQPAQEKEELEEVGQATLLEPLVSNGKIMSPHKQASSTEKRQKQKQTVTFEAEETHVEVAPAEGQGEKQQDQKLSEVESADDAVQAIPDPHTTESSQTVEPTESTQIEVVDTPVPEESGSKKRGGRKRKASPPLAEPQTRKSGRRK